MVRFLLPIFLLVQPFFLSGNDYDNDLMTIFSKLLPRIVLMSSLKPDNDMPVSICLVHDAMQSALADGFEEMLARHNAVQGVKVSHADFNNLSGCRSPQLLFVFEASATDFARTVNTITAKNVMVAAYNPHRLIQGADITLFVGRSVVPYINLQGLLKKNIRLKPLLLRVSKIYDHRGDR